MEISYWSEWQKPQQPWITPTNQGYCYNCGMWYFGVHECTNKPTITIGGSMMGFPAEKKMDKIKVVTKISSALGILSSVEEMSGFFDTSPEEREKWALAVIDSAQDILKEALEEMISD